MVNSKHVAVYYRVSTDKQAITSQVDRVSAHADSLHKEVVIYTDEGISGTTTARPAYQRMIAACERGEVHTVVVFALDRLGRNAQEANKLLLRLIDLGVEFVSVTQPLFSSDNPMRRTMMALFSDMAQMERDNIASRVKAGMAAYKQRRGYVGPASTLTPERLAMIHNLRAEGKSLRNIAGVLGVSHGLIQKALK